MNLNYILVILLTIPIFGISQEIDTSKIDSLFVQFDSTTSGIVISIVQDDKIVYTNGYGSANLIEGTPMDRSTILDIGSCAKTFTAVAILTLMDEGKLTLEDDIRKYLPQLPQYTDTIRIKHLGRHTSGLKEWIQLFHLSGYQVDGDPIHNRHVLNMIYSQQDLNFPPGTKYNYSNSNYTLLARIVENISGQKFSDFMNERFFKPLGMTKTFIHDDFYAQIENVACGYYLNDSTLQMLTLNMCAPGPGSLNTSAKDMGKWMVYFSKLMKENIRIRKVLESQTILDDGEAVNSGFGQYLEQYKGLDHWQHEGGGVGISSYVGYFPNQSLSIFVSCNDFYCWPQEHFFKIVDLILNLDEGISIDSEDNQNNHKDHTPVTSMQWTGHYWSDEASLARELLLKEDGIYYRRGNASGTQLIQLDSNSYSLLGSTGISIWFDIDPHGRRNMYFRFQSDPPIKFVEYEPLVLELEDLTQYKGIYFCKELRTGYTIDLGQEGLIATHLRKEDVPLNQVMKDLFTGNTAFSQVQFTRDSSDNIDGFVVSSHSAKGIVFKRIGQ